MREFIPEWQAFCYRRTGWRYRACFWIAGFIMLRPAPYHDAWKFYTSGQTWLSCLILASIPLVIFGLGVLIGWFIAYG
jgi:hypothetical protein